MNKYSLDIIWNGEVVDIFSFSSENDETANEKAKVWMEFWEGEYGDLYNGVKYNINRRVARGNPQ